MRQFHVVNRRSRRLERRKGLLDAVGHLGVEAWAEVLGNAADPQAGERLLEHLGVSGHIVGEAGGVARVVAGDRFQ